MEVPLSRVAPSGLSSACDNGSVDEAAIEESNDVTKLRFSGGGSVDEASMDESNEVTTACDSNRNSCNAPDVRGNASWRSNSSSGKLISSTAMV